MILVVLVLFSAFGAFSLLLFIPLDHVDELESVKKATMLPSKSPRIALVLQPSPVDRHEQGARLKVIDGSWAQWANTPSLKNSVKIFAPIDDDGDDGDDAAAAASFEYVNVERLRLRNVVPGGKAAAAELTNMERLMLVLLELHRTITNGNNNGGDGHYDYVVLGNDHSFFLLPNMVKHLRSLSQRSGGGDLVYTGHKLALAARVFKGGSNGNDVNNNNNKAVFASGGAGLVLSYSSVKLLLAAWTIANPAWLAKACSSNDGEGMAMRDKELCALQAHTSKRPLSLRGGSDNPQYQQGATIHIGLSRSLALEVVDGGSSSSKGGTVRLLRRVGASASSSHAAAAASSSSSSSSSSSLEEVVVVELPLRSMKQCQPRPQDVWGGENGGVYAAHCLLDLFGASFPSSRSGGSLYPPNGGTGGYNYPPGGGDNEGNGELYNVYGPVRILRGQADKWWFDAKRHAGEEVHQRHHSDNEHHDNHHSGDKKGGSSSSSSLSLGLSPALVSFHYVNSAECRVLYRYLTQQQGEQPPNHSSSSSGGGDGHVEQQRLLEDWKVAEWAYGRHPAGEQEAQQLLEWLHAARSHMAMM
jgi:hypothetical protein